MFGVPDDRLDGVVTFQRTAQRPGQGALLPGDVYGGIGDAVSAITSINEAALRFAAGECLNLGECGFQGVPVERIVG